MAEADFVPDSTSAEPDFVPDVQVSSHTRGDTQVQAHTRSAPGWKDAVRKGLDFVPAAGAMAGEALGGGAGSAAGGIGAIPGAAAGAFLGGGLGAGVKSLGNQLLGDQQSAPEAVASMGKEGLIQSLYQLGGQAAAKLAGTIANPVMQWALKAHPEVAGTAIAEGITGTRMGLQKVMNLIGDAGNNAMAIARRAGQRGLRYQAIDLVDEVNQRLVPDIAGQAQKAGDLKTLNSLNRGFLNDNSNLIRPEQAMEIRRSSDAIAEPLHEMTLKKEPINAADAMRLKWHKTMADVIREHLGQITDPGVTSETADIGNSMAEAQAHTQRLVNVKNALVPVVTPPGKNFAARLAARATGGAALGAMLPGDRTRHGVEGALLGAAGTSPALLSQMAILMSNPAIANLVTQGSRLAGSALAP